MLVGLVLPMSALTSAGGAGLGDPEGWCPGPHRHLWLMAELLLLTHQWCLPGQEDTPCGKLGGHRIAVPICWVGVNGQVSERTLVAQVTQLLAA